MTARLHRLGAVLARETARNPEYPARLVAMSVEAKGDRPCDAWLRETQERIRKSEPRLGDLDAIACFLARRIGAKDVAAEGYRLRPFLDVIKRHRGVEVAVHADRLVGENCAQHRCHGIECEARARQTRINVAGCCVQIAITPKPETTRDHEYAALDRGLPHFYWTATR